MTTKDTSPIGFLRRLLTTQHSIKYLFLVLIGSWVWLWVSLGNPPILTYLGYTLIALVFLWTRPFGALRYVVETGTARRRQDAGKEKRDFLYLLAEISVLPVVFTLLADVKTGTLILGSVCLAAVIYIVVMPGETFPEGWLTKRWSRRKRRAAHR